MGKKFVVRFVRADNQPVEEYYFVSEKEGNQHIDLFKDDNSELYKFIALVDIENNLVLRILIFERGKRREDLRDRDIVRLRSGYRTAGEAKYLFSVTNINENTGHCTIICLNSGLSICPSENVGLETINRVVGVDDVLLAESEKY